MRKHVSIDFETTPERKGPYHGCDPTDTSPSKKQIENKDGANAGMFSVPGDNGRYEIKPQYNDEDDYKFANARH